MHSTATSTKYCHACAAILDRRAEICPHCGVRQPGMYAAAPTVHATEIGRKRVAAGVLAILLGGLGVHKFFLGKIGQGLLYLLFFWTAIPAIIGLIEGIIYLTTSDEDFAARYQS